MAGLPVAGSAFPGIAEVIARGQVGLLFDPADPESISVALEGLVQDPAQRRAMGARARVLAETSYNWGLEKQALLEVYGRLEGASGSDGA
jgi:glycogen(starch) synthase